MNGTVGPVRVITRTRTLRWRSVRFRSGPDRGSEPNLPITTKKDLKSHDLFKQFDKCDSPEAILAKFQATHFDDPSQTGSDDRLKRWLVPTLNVLCAFSDTLGEGVSLVIMDSSLSL